ncbi:MAG: M24 family metallopeptidase, partial [Promethearchaeota archaeon]
MVDKPKSITGPPSKEELNGRLKKVRKFITDNGYGDYIIHRTGHGLGITGHEAPFLAEGYDRKL